MSPVKMSAMKWFIFSGILCVASAIEPQNIQTAEPSTGCPAAQEVHLKQGLITGQRRLVADEGGRCFYAFQGIPYAEPPVGKLRFKDPVPAGPWSRPRQGSYIPPECPQPAYIFYSHGVPDVDGDEDCLYLNVFTPKVSNTSLLPVMVWIHGGSFTYGNASFYSPLPLLTRDVVLVTIQYRLKTLGFLSTGDSVMPGNFGLKDQTLALRWVQENIRDLGGDPNRVTIFGESSGGASVHYQMLTPSAQGLFHRAILQSGTALCSWAQADGYRELALRYGELFNCSGLHSSALTSNEILACLQRVSFQELTMMPYNDIVWGHLPSLMKPRVDFDYIPDHPAILVREGKYNKVDLISGVNKDEGADSTVDVLSNPELVKGLNENFSEIGPLLLNLGGTDENQEYMAKRVFYYYLNETQIHEDKAEQIKELFGDGLYTICQGETTHFHGRHTSPGTGHQVYRYNLCHRGQWTYAGNLSNTNTENWVSHADDLQYLFEGSVSPFKPLERDDDLFVRDIMLSLWTNFAATGNPTPDQSLGFRWIPVSETGMLRRLAIKTVPDMEVDLKFKERKFWKELPTEQNFFLYPELYNVH